MSLPKVLIAAPTSNNKDYCFKEYAKNITNFTYPEKDYFFVDNSKDPNYYHKIIKAGFPCIHSEPKGEPAVFIAECQNKIRQHFLKGDWDFLLMLETDVFPPANIIEWMIGFREAVFNVTYFVDYHGQTAVCCTYNCENHSREQQFSRTHIMPMLPAFHSFTGEQKQITDYKIAPDISAYSTGIGCTLIAREVMELVAFKAGIGVQIFSDSYFHKDLNEAGISNIYDTSIIVEHRRKGWQTYKF